MPKIYTFFGLLTFVVVVFHYVTRWFFRSLTQRLAVFISMLFVIMIYGYLVFNLEISEIIMGKIENKNE
ncbi:MAG: hypothetical protein EAX90_09445 [Candidatus Heimdallarchaeota archaeon]|nr:hypothetical protein [Candidatus Heimdallarchaeota archaeon]